MWREGGANSDKDKYAKNISQKVEEGILNKQGFDAVTNLLASCMADYIKTNRTDRTDMDSTFAQPI